MPQPPSLLLVDDDADKRCFLELFIRRQLGAVTITHCESGAEAIEQLQKQPVHVIITDQSMHPVSGIELTRWVRSHFPSLPVLMVTGNPGIAPDALRAGVNHVLGSTDFELLGPILRSLLAGNFS